MKVDSMSRKRSITDDEALANAILGTKRRTELKLCGPRAASPPIHIEEDPKSSGTASTAIHTPQAVTTEARSGTTVNNNAGIQIIEIESSPEPDQCSGSALTSVGNDSPSLGSVGGTVYVLGAQNNQAPAPPDANWWRLQNGAGQAPADEKFWNNVKLGLDVRIPIAKLYRGFWVSPNWFHSQNGPQQALDRHLQPTVLDSSVKRTVSHCIKPAVSALLEEFPELCTCALSSEGICFRLLEKFVWLRLNALRQHMRETSAIVGQPRLKLPLTFTPQRPKGVPVFDPTVVDPAQHGGS